MGTPEHGTASVSPTGRVVYTSNRFYEGEDSFGIKVTDGVSKPAYLIFPVTVSLDPDCISSESQTCGPEDAVNGNNTKACEFYKSCGKPVNVSTGAMWHQFLDFSLPGRTPETGLPFERTYTAFSAGGGEGDFGPNWSHSWESKLKFKKHGSEVSAITLVDENGGPWKFRYVEGQEAYSNPGGVQIQITPIPNSRAGIDFEITRPQITRQRFSEEGRLQTQTDRFGETVTLAYDANNKLETVTSPFAGTIRFTRNELGLVSAVTRERDNLTTNYFYNENRKLIKVVDHANRVWEYEYNMGQVGTNAHGMLSLIRDPIGRELKFTYYDDGRAYQQFEPGGGVRTFTYTFSPLSHSMKKNRLNAGIGINSHGNYISSTRVDEIDGTSTTYFFDEYYRTIRTVHPDGGMEQEFWGSNGRRSRVKDELGHETRFQYDGKLNISSIKRPGISTPTTITYNQDFDVPTSITPPVGAPTIFTLDPTKGTVLRTERSGEQGTLALDFTRDSFGNQLSVNNGITTYTDQRDANGFLTYKFDSFNPETRSYDQRGRLTSRQFHSGRQISYSYNDDDQITQITDSHGPNESREYDVVMRLVKKIVTDGAKLQVTTYVWDEQDRLVSETDALGRKTEYGYDKRRVRPQPSFIKDPAGRITRFKYDQRNRMIAKTDPLGATTRFEYNKRGDLISVTDANGNVTSFSYDPAGRKIEENRPSVAGKNAARHRITYQYDDADRLIAQVHHSATGGEDRTIAYEYDSYDRMVKKSLYKGSVLEDEAVFTYEAQLDASSVASVVNGVKSLGFTNVPAPPFASAGFSVAAATSGNPYGLIEDQFSLERDATGNISRILGANAGEVYRKKYDPAGRLTGVTSGTHRIALQYDGFGRRKAISHSDGTSGTFSYDILNRTTEVKWREQGKDSVQQYLQYDLAGNITRLAREHSVYDLKYDAVDQLIESRFNGKPGVPDYNRWFGYDLLGNRLQDSQNGNGEHLANFLLQNAKSSFQADADGFGETVKEVTEEKEKHFSYRADGKISGFQSGNLQVSYLYDGFDRLAAKLINENGNMYTQSFLHLDKDVRVLLGKAGDNSVTTYIDGEGPAERLGEVKAGVGKGYVTDHLGSVLNSPVGGSTKSFGLFGEPAANVSLSQTSSPVIQGWQGLDFDAATGNWNNNARQYNQSAGIFTSQDPSGLNGGINLYGSRLNSPLAYLDPTGNGPILAGACLLYNAYQGYQTVAGIKQLAQQIDKLDAEIAALRKKEKSCPPEDRVKLAQQINEKTLQQLTLIQQKTHEEAIGGAKALVIGAACYGLGKLPLPYGL